MQPPFQIRLALCVFPYHLPNLTTANPFFPVEQWRQLVTPLRIPQGRVPHHATLPEEHPAPISEEVYHSLICLSSFCPNHQFLTSPWYKGFRMQICPLASLVPPAAPSSSAVHLLGVYHFLQLWCQQRRAHHTSWSWGYSRMSSLPHSLSPASVPRVGSTNAHKQRELKG